MRSLELPAGSVLIASRSYPDGVYVVRKGLVGLFDSLGRLIIVVYRDEVFGLESISKMVNKYVVKTLTFAEIDMYNLGEFEHFLDGEKRKNILKQIAKWNWLAEKRYQMNTEDRLADILKELKSVAIDESYMDQILVSLELNDALIFERIRREMM
ncbi:MAG: hypothetical protein J7L34_01055 [Thermotogaceae bacterium]|nr:hypothetical protein [Thermotogaceae bacterium]